MAQYCYPQKSDKYDFDMFLDNFKKQVLRHFKKNTAIIVAIGDSDKILFYRADNLDKVKPIGSIHSPKYAIALNSRFREVGIMTTSEALLPYSLFEITGYDYYTLYKNDVDKL